MPNPRRRPPPPPPPPLPPPPPPIPPETQTSSPIHFRPVFYPCPPRYIPPVRRDCQPERTTSFPLPCMTPGPVARGVLIRKKFLPLLIDDVSGSECSEEDQQTPTPNPGQGQCIDEDQQAATTIPGISQVQYAEEDQPVPTHKLDIAQRCEVPNTLELELNTTASLSSCVSSLTPTGLLIKYFVRGDKGGFYHTYPDRGGPFRSLQDAQHAIDSYHVVERKNLCMDGLSDLERSVRYALYWPHDGTRRNSAEAFAAMATRRPVREVVKALLDKYNEENPHLEDHPYELEDIVSYKPCFDGKGCAYRSYSHLNMTMKTKRADDSPRANKKLYFAEVTCMIDEHEEYVLTCFCRVEPGDNGECLVCGDEMKHPTDTEYNHGRFKAPIRCCSNDADAAYLYDKLVTVRDEAWLKAEEARVRRMFEEDSEAMKRDDEARDRRDNKYVVPARRAESGGSYGRTHVQGSGRGRGI